MPVFLIRCPMRRSNLHLELLRRVCRSLRRMFLLDYLRQTRRWCNNLDTCLGSNTCENFDCIKKIPRRNSTTACHASSIPEWRPLHRSPPSFCLLLLILRVLHNRQPFCRKDLGYNICIPYYSLFCSMTITARFN